MNRICTFTVSIATDEVEALIRRYFEMPTREEEIAWAIKCRERREQEAMEEQRVSMNLVLDAVENWIRKIILDAPNQDYAIDVINAREQLIEVLEQELKK